MVAVFVARPQCICQGLEHLASMIEERADRSLTINRTRKLAVTAQRSHR
jgi:hypothetical protein